VVQPLTQSEASSPVRKDEIAIVAHDDWDAHANSTVMKKSAKKTQSFQKDPLR